MKKAFAVEVEVPDDVTEQQLQVIQDAIQRVEKYVANTKVTQILPFEVWAATHSQKASGPDIASVVPVISTPTETAPDGWQAVFAAEPTPTSPVSGEAPPKPLFPGASGQVITQTTQPPEEDVHMFPTVELHRDLLVAIAKGAYSPNLAEWISEVLADMPIGATSVRLVADYGE